MKIRIRLRQIVIMQQLFDEWKENRAEAKRIEEQYTELKARAQTLMDSQDTTVLELGDQRIRRNESTYRMISKDCVPAEIFEQYAKEARRVVFTTSKVSASKTTKKRKEGTTVGPSGRKLPASILANKKPRGAKISS